MLDALAEHFPPQAEWTRPGGRPVHLGDAARLHRHDRPAGAGAARQRRVRAGRGGLPRRPRAQLDAAQLLRLRRGVDPRGHPPHRRGRDRAGRAVRHADRRARRRSAAGACEPDGARGACRCRRRRAARAAAGRQREPRRGPQGRPLAGAAGVAALRRAGRGRAGAARPRGRPDRRRPRPDPAAARRATRRRLHRDARARRRGRHRPGAARDPRRPVHGLGRAGLRALDGQGAGQAPDDRGGDPDAGVLRVQRDGVPRARRGRGAAARSRSGWTFPIVVKPSSQGSALGIKFARSAADVPAALVAAFSYDSKVLLERHVDGPRPGGLDPRRRAAAGGRGGAAGRRVLRLPGPLRDRPHELRLPGRAAGRRDRAGAGAGAADLPAARAATPSRAST